jgi:hypothetical protein
MAPALSRSPSSPPLAGTPHDGLAEPDPSSESRNDAQRRRQPARIPSPDRRQTGRRRETVRTVFGSALSSLPPGRGRHQVASQLSNDHRRKPPERLQRARPTRSTPIAGAPIRGFVQSGFCPIPRRRGPPVRCAVHAGSGRTLIHSDEVAQLFRADVARRSDVMSPGGRALAGVVFSSPFRRSGQGATDRVRGLRSDSPVRSSR